MENKDNMQLPGHPEGCRCFGCCGAGFGMGMHRYGLGFMVLRLLLGLLILLIVFWLGVKIGEFKGMVGYGYDSGMHHRYMIRGYYDGYYGYPGYPGMMQQAPLNQNVPTTVAPATPKSAK